MKGGIGKGDTILIEVVAYRDLPAESITAAVEIHLVVLVITSLHQDGDVQLRIVDGIDDTDLEAEVRQ